VSLALAFWYIVVPHRSFDQLNERTAYNDELPETIRDSFRVFGITSAKRGKLRMRPRIDRTEFGSITIDGDELIHDVIIRLNGKVKKRKKKLSKATYGTSHVISLDEAKQVYQEGADQLIIGAGQYGNVVLSDEAQTYFKLKRCRVKLLPTPDAIDVWNKADGAVIGLFHVTC